MTTKKPNKKTIVSLEDVKKDSRVSTLLKQANKQMEVMEYTEHGERHANLVSHIARNVLIRLDFEPRTAELAAIAGYFHDIGNVIHRDGHAHSSALIAMHILQDLGMPSGEVAVIMGAVGNHEEERGVPVSDITAAVIIADKTDVHRSRVQKQYNLDLKTPATTSIQDIHDRVNYSANRSFVYVDGKKKIINLKIEIDTKISQIMDYFEIFLTRMLIVRRAVTYLDCKFELHINETKIF